MPPGTFLPILEELNLGPQLDRYVVRKLAAWMHIRKSQNKLGVAHVNLCTETLADQSFCSYVETQLTQTQTAGDSLCFEFPGNDNGNRAMDVLLAKSLSKLGCHISVGATEDETIEFRQMRLLGASFLKIGRKLIQELTRSDTAAAEVKVAARACRSFDVHTIAQHVEDTSTLDLLRKLDVSFAQGYGISKPGPLRNVAKSVQKVR